MKPLYHGLFNHGEFTDTCEGCSLKLNTEMDFAQGYARHPKSIYAKEKYGIPHFLFTGRAELS